MNIRDLKYIIAVAETHHFGKAAERCFVSQPTLSGQIKKLEDDLGVSIFERTNRSVEITPIGEEILKHAHQIIEQADLIKQLALAHQDPLAGPLRIGAIPTLSPYLMTLILRPLRQQYPQLKLVLSEEMTDTLLERLRNHEIDAALLATDIREQDLDVKALFDEPFWLAHSTEHEFYNKDEITQKDLDNTELLLLSEGHCLAKQAMEICHIKERKESEMADLRASSLETLLQLVSAGFGSTLIPALAMNGNWLSGSGVVARKLEIKNAYRRISLVHRKSYPRQQALQAFSAIIQQNLPNTVQLVTEKIKSK
ncbi:MAG: LysR substrate-binding domain-containing protein [Gammaproteobacteria bacterium]|nr:LysR substrate-binding domain-containing protein [Gammaproteobacteria bacterium]